MSARVDYVSREVGNLTSGYIIRVEFLHSKCRFRSYSYRLRRLAQRRKVPIQDVPGYDHLLRLKAAFYKRRASYVQFTKKEVGPVAFSGACDRPVQKVTAGDDNHILRDLRAENRSLKNQHLLASAEILRLKSISESESKRLSQLEIENNLLKIKLASGSLSVSCGETLPPSLKKKFDDQISALKEDHRAEVQAMKSHFQTKIKSRVEENESLAKLNESLQTDLKSLKEKVQRLQAELKDATDDYVRSEKRKKQIIAKSGDALKILSRLKDIEERQAKIISAVATNPNSSLRFTKEGREALENLELVRTLVGHQTDGLKIIRTDASKARTELEKLF